MGFQSTKKSGAGRKARSAPFSMEGLGRRLRRWREKNDLSQSQAALKLRVSKRTLQEWEQGRAEPRHLAWETITAAISR
jgi:DNA-binding transcriptional regulator YiaG